MRVCISYTHIYSNKSLSHTSPLEICKMCFWANMQVASSLWPDRKSQKILEHRFRLNSTKCSPRIEGNPLRTDHTSMFRQGKAQVSPAPAVGAMGAAGRPADHAGRPACLWLTRSVHRGLTASHPWLLAINMRGEGENRTHSTHTHTSPLTYLKCLLA